MIKYNWSSIKKHTKGDINKILKYFYYVYIENTDLAVYLLENKYASRIAIESEKSSMLTRETFTGPWAGLPVAWTDDDRFDETTYRGDVTRCCGAGVPGVYSGGTTGEFYAMEFDEFQEIARATVEACHACGKPARTSRTLKTGRTSSRSW